MSDENQSKEFNKDENQKREVKLPWRDTDAELVTKLQEMADAAASKRPHTVEVEYDKGIVVRCRYYPNDAFREMWDWLVFNQLLALALEVTTAEQKSWPDFDKFLVELGEKSDPTTM